MLRYQNMRLEKRNGYIWVQKHMKRLSEYYLKKKLLGDLEQMTKQVNTTMLEVFHAVKIGYLPKKTCFSINKMIAGMQIAVLDHIHNINREQVSITEMLFGFAQIDVNKK